MQPVSAGPVHEVTLAYDAFNRLWKQETGARELTLGEPKAWAINDRLALFQANPRRPGVTGKRLTGRVTKLTNDNRTVHFEVTGRYSETTDRSRRR